MPSRKDLILYERNTEQIAITVTLDSGAYDLTGASVEMLIKANADTVDTDPSVTLLTIGAGVEVLAATSGQIRVTIPAGVTVTPGARWYRLDVVNGQARRTALLGTLYVTNV